LTIFIFIDKLSLLKFKDIQEKIMAFSYKPLFKLLVDKEMKKTDLHAACGLSSATLAKLSKGEYLSGASIDKICAFFNCQPGDIIAYVPDDQKEPIAEL
jgi:DNA-binding Xre family transcriptional regulator